MKLEEIHAKALADAQARTDRFFERHGLTRADVELAHAEYKKFCEDEEKFGKHFYTSPLGFKAFAVGFFKCCKGTKQTTEKGDL